ncbi:hypothetical protein R3P38DRAFT_2948380 [Favolaschia claudopus]|uniref:Uncharacterized protein n=1 Tax=Favolaschia claudopus TaxID=2862362 RepID=A0AAW0BJC7_9AGAR
MSESEDLVDITEDLCRLVERSKSLRSPVFAPADVHDWISGLVESSPAPSRPSTQNSSRSNSPGISTNEGPNKVEYDVRLTRETVLSVLYTYDNPDFHLEYPETSEEGVGYLIRRDPNNWTNPLHDSAYSKGKPSGRTTRGKEISCQLLNDQTNSGQTIPCVRAHSSCQGAKCCPQAKIEDLTVPHTKPSRELIKERLEVDLEEQCSGGSPTRDIFMKTAAFIVGIRALGCGFHETDAPPQLPLPEKENKDFWDAHLKSLQRGYVHTQATCSGRVSLDYNSNGQALVRCEFYSSTNRLHLCRFIDESYDLEYVEAFFYEDDDELERIERSAYALGYGPLVPCRTVVNFSTQRLHCPHDHRDEEGRLIQPTLVHLPCDTKFVTYEPIEELRQACPYILVVSKGVHEHPIPLPQKTPPHIRAEVIRILKSIDDDLADLTPRRFLRHPVLKSYLHSCFPDILNVTLMDLHSSLANREHLRAYIAAAKVDLFPAGTGWKGVLRLKEWQDTHIDADEHYIRRIIEVPDFPLDEFDAENPIASGSPASTLQIIICMSRTGSERLLKAQYIQSDIAFRRIEEFLEFEMAAMDRIANTSVIFLRVYVNRQTAAAHQLIFGEIEKIVTADTGSELQWRHLHGESVTDVRSGMILQWTGDQHGGQAKGIGLHLQQLAQAMPEKHDLHEPQQLLASLGPYEHLRRIFRLCSVHGKRNIKSCSVPDSVRNLMRSLFCIRHPDWDGTISAIQRDGGKAGIDWVQDKIRSKFAFAGICWEKSFIPEEVWKAGEGHTNLIESVHADVNREGVRCTLVGGIKKGQAFDKMKMRTLEMFEEFNIRPSYKSGHLSENAVKSLKRKNRSTHKNLAREDVKIEAYNTKLQKLYQSLSKACELQRRSAEILTSQPEGGDFSSALAKWQKAAEACDKAQVSYQKQVQVAAQLPHGSGKVNVLVLPDAHP